MKKNFLILFIILLVFSVGCSNYSKLELVNIQNNKNENITRIEKEGYFEDSAGNIFDAFLKSKHFYFYYNSEDTIGKIYLITMKNYLETNYKKVTDFFHIDENDMPIVEIYFYAKYKEFNCAVLKDRGLNLHNYGDPTASTISENKIYITHSTMHNNVKFIYMSALHEYVHCCTMVIGANPPMWLREGIALYLTNGKDFYQDKYEDFIANGLPYEYILNSTGRYTYTYSMVEYIAETYGNDKLLELIKSDGDYEKALGLTIEEFENGWIKFLKDKTT